MTPSNDVCAVHETIREDLAEIKQDVKSVLTKLNDDDVSFAKLGARVCACEGRLDQIESHIKWGVRLIIGSVILSILGMIIANHQSIPK